MGLKADIVKALRVSLDKDDSEHLAKEIMDRLPPVYEAAPEMLDMLILLLPYIEDAQNDTAYKPGTVANRLWILSALIKKAEGETQ